MSITIESLIADAQVKMFPDAAQRIVTLAQSEKSTVTQLEEAIRVDQGLAGRVLKISSSPIYSQGKTITDLRRAIVLVGFEAIRDLALSLSILDMFDRNDPLASFFWEHALGVATGARALALNFEGVEAATVFLSGLMHDMGKGVLLSQAEQTFRPLYDDRAAPGFDGAAREREAFGFDHCELGHAMCESWGFPATVALCVRYHHELATLYELEVSQTDIWTVATVALADSLSKRIGVATGKPDGGIDPATSEANNILALPAEGFDALCKEIEEKVYHERAAFMS